MVRLFNYTQAFIRPNRNQEIKSMVFLLEKEVFITYQRSSL